MKYKNYLNIRIQAEQAVVLKNAILAFNAQTNYKLKITDFKPHNGAYNVEIRFKTTQYIFLNDLSYILFDFAKVFRDKEIQHQ